MRSKNDIAVKLKYDNKRFGLGNEDSTVQVESYMFKLAE